MFKWIKEKIKNAWEKVRSFFKDSEVIALARGLVVAGIGFISSVATSIDWSNVVSLIMNPGFTKEQLVLLGGLAVVIGFATEVARRMRATDL